MENVVPVRKRLPEGTPSVVLNSADFGVPQTRRRCFAGEGWLAEPTHLKDEWVSVLDALPYLNDLSNSADVLMDSGRSSSKTSGVNPRTGKKEGGSGPLFRGIDEPSYTIMSSPRVLKLEALGSTRIVSRRRKKGEEPQSYTPTRPAHTITQVQHIIENISLNVNTAGCGSSNGRRANSVDSPIEKPSKTIYRHTPSLRLKLEALGSNAKRTADRDITEPSKTICGSGNQVGARIFNHTDETPQKIRSLTISETLVLQGFSPDYDLSSATTQKARWTMIGNAVPPPVAAAVIRGIQNGLLT
jgi:site-specific DNA-cytosine methylase